MSGFSPDASELQRLGRVLSGDASLAEKQQVQTDLSDHASHMKRFLRGLQDFPTSLLAIALESHFDATVGASTDDPIGRKRVFDEIELRRVIAEVLSSYLEGRAAFISDNRTIIDRVREQFVGLAASRLEQASFFEAAGRILESQFVELSRRRMEGELDRDESSAAGNETVSAAGHTTLSLSLNRPGEVLARQQRLSRLELHDPSLVRIYVLYTFAGRTHQEIAELLGMAVSDVVESEQVATVEVCMEET